MWASVLFLSTIIIIPVGIFLSSYLSGPDFSGGNSVRALPLSLLLVLVAQFISWATLVTFILIIFKKENLNQKFITFALLLLPLILIVCGFSLERAQISDYLSLGENLTGFVRAFSPTFFVFSVF